MPYNVVQPVQESSLYYSLETCAKQRKVSVWIVSVRTHAGEMESL